VTGEEVDYKSDEQPNQPMGKLLIPTLTDRVVCETAVASCPFGQRFKRAELMKRKKPAILDSLPLQRGARN
jgi:hypothetical protein